MQPITFAIFAALVVVAAASNYGCPHPSEAKHLLLEKLVITQARTDGRHTEEIELPKEILGHSDISCVMLESRRHGSTPDYVSLGRNKKQGYSVILHSRIRNTMNCTLYVYGQ